MTSRIAVCLIQDAAGKWLKLKSSDEFRINPDTLVKTDLGVASRYAGLVADARLRKTVFGAIEAEHALALRHLLAILGQTANLQRNPVLANSIRARFPYIDPLNHLQVELVRRYRADAQNLDERSRRAIHISINGIAAGLRNTG